LSAKTERKIAMTTVYFVRHAETDRSTGEDATYSLSEKGARDCALVTNFLRDKKIDAVFSSSFKRAVDTVAPFAEEAGLEIKKIYDFRERKHPIVRIEEWQIYVRK
jgi:2,3-bisphosphoglycerate-dependent phosphoglycerate mutase